MNRTKRWVKSWVLVGLLAIAGLGGLTVNCGSSMGPEGGGTNTFKCCNADLQYFSCTQEAAGCEGCTRDSTKDAMCAVAV